MVGLQYWVIRGGVGAGNKDTAWDWPLGLFVYSCVQVYCDLSCELEVKGRLGTVAGGSRASAYHARPPPESPTSAILAPDLSPHGQQNSEQPSVGRAFSG